MYNQQFKPGQRVKFIPNHALGDPNHPDIETGIVEKVTRDTVRIRFEKEVRTEDVRWIEAVAT